MKRKRTFNLFVLVTLLALALGMQGIAPAHALTGQTILIASADCGISPTTIQANILALDPTSTVDLFDAFTGTPTLVQMQAYDTVVVFSNCVLKWNCLG